MIVPPGFNSPFASASSIIFSPIRSLTLPPGFIISSLASARQGTPAMIFGSLTKGVFPIVSRMLSKTRIARPTPSPTLDEKDGRYKNVRGSVTSDVLPNRFGLLRLRNRSRDESERSGAAGREGRTRSRSPRARSSHALALGSNHRGRGRGPDHDHRIRHRGSSAQPPAGHHRRLGER